jgi:hypothetical protein
MGKRTPRLPVASAGPGDPIASRSANTGLIRSLARPKVGITDSDWQRIEKAYRQKLSPEARRDIHEKTQEFVDRAEFEQNAEPVSDARDRITTIIGAASSLRSALDGGDYDADVYARTLIKKHLQKEGIKKHLQKEGDAIKRRRRKKDDPLRNISSGVRLLIFASQDALRELDEMPAEMTSWGWIFATWPSHVTFTLAYLSDPPSRASSPRDQGFSKGEAWDRWIERLTSIAKAHNLPWRVRKDSDKQSDRPSPFVEFVWGLQQFVPGTHRRAHSKDALAKAITEARRQKRDE